MPKLFNVLKPRYAERPGGYTRILRTEPKKDDQAASAILELVDGPLDMRFASTAAIVARDRALGLEHSEITIRNIERVTRYRKDGEAEFERMVRRTGQLNLSEAGTQLADIEPVIANRVPGEDDMVKRAKPVHDYWNPAKSEGKGTWKNGARRTAKSLSDEIGEPQMKPEPPATPPPSSS